MQSDGGAGSGGDAGGVDALAAQFDPIMMIPRTTPEML
jgi:hypothetical protein